MNYNLNQGKTSLSAGMLVAGCWLLVVVVGCAATARLSAIH